MLSSSAGYRGYGVRVGARVGVSGRSRRRIRHERPGAGEAVRARLRSPRVDGRRRGSRSVDVMPGWSVSATEGDPRARGRDVREPDGERETIEADPLLVSGGWNPNLGLWRAIGGGLGTTRRAACFVPDGADPAGSVRGRRAAGERPGHGATFCFVPAGDDARSSSTSSATRPWPTSLPRSRAGLRVGRAREARDLHRHGHRPGPNQRRSRGRDRERVSSAGPGGRTGAVERPAPVHAGGVRHLGGSVPGRPARPDPPHADPRVARRARRRVRERRAVEAALVFPSRRRVDRRNRRARVPRRPKRGRRDGRLDARQDRGGRTGLRRRSSIGCTRTGCRT